jgi:hypothetical protein
MNLNYLKIPLEHRLGNLENDKLVLFRGDLIGLETMGIKSKAKKEDLTNKIYLAKEIIESGNLTNIRKLIDSHTSGSYNSGLISTSFNPEMAQVFATGQNSTIYRIEVPVNRVILDIENIGCCYSSKEILVLGEILPSEITAIKKINSDIESELLFLTQLGGRAIRSEPLKSSSNQDVKNLKNWLVYN